MTPPMPATQDQAQLAPDQQLAGFALDSPKLVGSLVGLVRLRDSATLGRILNKHPVWPEHTIGQLMSAVWRLNDVHPKTDLLEAILPHASGVTPTSGDIIFAVSAFFAQKTPGRARAWMVNTHIPSLNPHTTWDQEMLRCVWGGLADNNTGPHSMANTSSETAMAWLTAHTAHCPELNRPPTPQECATIRAREQVPKKPMPARDFLTQSVVTMLYALRQEHPARYTDMLHALGAHHPCLLSWCAEHLCLPHIKAMIQSSRRSHLTGLLDDLLDRMPSPSAKDLARWLTTQTPLVSPSVAALASAGAIESALTPNDRPTPAPKTMRM